VIRAFRAADLPAFVAYRREPLVARYQSWDVDYSIEDARRMLAELADVRLGDVGVWVQLAVVDAADGTLVGDCASRMLDDPPRTAEIGVTLAPGRQARGYAREAVGALVGALLDGHDVHRLVAEVDDRNVAAQRLVDGLGFRLEARFVEADWFKGEWTTLRVYAVLAGEAAAIPDRAGSRCGRGERS
jgi:RimJ/RimL family protein N-acetyltransferase